MKKAICCAVVPLLFVGSSLGNPTRGEGGSHSSISNEAVECDITVKATNRGSRRIYFHHDRRYSQVRTRRGTWLQFFFGIHIDPGKTLSSVGHVQFFCNAHRRYRFRLTRGGQEYTYYYPSSSGFTQSTTLNLGDVNRFF